MWNPPSYLGPTGWANVTGGSTMSVFAVSASFARRAMFFTDTGYSWIIGRNMITRRRYGAELFVPDHRAGRYRLAMSDRLVAGQALTPGTCLSSPGGDYDVVFEENGDATVYECDKPTGERAIWSSGSAKARHADASG
ncbi:hypothetical protein GCM10011505_00840 [Tistrella bauzanensis]|uniref:Uncharacterized protein n=1 Tax=Tistrella bauzanensis TaxID=657419 RepID=A0ABQ1I899_9PROT|nr:hypothetical protein GCM10011505_00840 [Tistrella bauzanensis]